MCKKIKEVNELTPDEVLGKFWDNDVPVNIKRILSKIGISFYHVDFSTLEQKLDVPKNDAILGLAFSKDDDLGILYSSRINQDAANYVLAHELAHCCLHMKPTSEFHVELKISSDMYSSPRKEYPVIARHKDAHKEWQADRFAADLLMPTQALIDFISKNPGQSVESIARHFHVSKEIARLKIVNLRQEA